MTKTRNNLCLACRGYQKKPAANHMARFGIQKEVCYCCKYLVAKQGFKTHLLNVAHGKPLLQQATYYYLQGGRGSVKKVIPLFVNERMAKVLSHPRYINSTALGQVVINSTGQFCYCIFNCY